MHLHLTMTFDRDKGDTNILNKKICGNIFVVDDLFANKKISLQTDENKNDFSTDILSLEISICISI